MRDLKIPRTQLILDCFDQYDVVTISLLSEVLGVSHMSIRRDLKILEARSLITVMYGGEVKRNFLNRAVKYTTKQQKNSKGKKVISELAIDIIEPGMFIFVDSGTTTYELIQKIEIPVTIVTPDIHIALALNSKLWVKTILCPGEIDPATAAIFDTQTMKFIADQMFDLSFIGADSFSLEAGAMTTSQAKADCKWMAMKKSVQNYLLVDQSKENIHCRYKICNLDQFDTVITDFSLNDTVLKKYQDKGVNLIYPTSTS